MPAERHPGADGRPRPVRLFEVAREAGLAPSTVSRAFSNPERVNFQTREHIHAVARRLGYHARPLEAPESATARTLDLLVQDIANPYYLGLIRGAARRARAAGYTLVLGDAAEAPELERAHIGRLMGTVEGFMISARWLTDEDLLDLHSKRPVVLFNREVDGLSSVVTDSYEGTRQIVEHLAGLGHRSIVYLAGPRASWSDSQRWAALQDATAELGVGLQRRGPFMPTLERGAAAADAALGTSATAVVAFNDQLAIGVLRRFLQRGVRVPAEVSVVGYDDTFGSDFCEPPLTTLAAPVEAAGRRLTELLLGELAGSERVQRIVLPTRLRVRQSSGPAPE